MVCKYCGKTIAENSKSCPGCGHSTDYEGGTGFWDLAGERPEPEEEQEERRNAAQFRQASRWDPAGEEPEAEEEQEEQRYAAQFRQLDRQQDSDKEDSPDTGRHKKQDYSDSFYKKLSVLLSVVTALALIVCIGLQISAAVRNNKLRRCESRIESLEQELENRRRLSEAQILPGLNQRPQQEARPAGDAAAFETPAPEPAAPDVIQDVDEMLPAEGGLAPGETLPAEGGLAPGLSLPGTQLETDTQGTELQQTESPELQG